MRSAEDDCIVFLHAMRKSTALFLFHDSFVCQYYVFMYNVATSIKNLFE